jgi:hypothetical protein
MTSSRAKPKATNAEVEDAIDETIEIGTMAALAVLPQLVAAGGDPLAAALEAWAAAAVFMQSRDRWIDALYRHTNDQG